MKAEQGNKEAWWVYASVQWNSQVEKSARGCKMIKGIKNERMKGNVYRTRWQFDQPSCTVWGLGAWGKDKKQRRRLQKRQLKFLMAVVWMDMNSTWEEEQIWCFGGKATDVWWFGHVLRKGGEYIGRKMLRWELLGRVHRCGKGGSYFVWEKRTWRVGLDWGSWFAAVTPKGISQKWKTSKLSSDFKLSLPFVFHTMR